MSNDVFSTLKPGDIVLLGSTNFVSRAIQFFMKKLRRKLGLPVPDGIVANHTGVLVNMWGQLYIAEAMQHGLLVSPFMERYKNRLEYIKILSPKKPYSLLEQEKISRAAIDDSLNGHKYDFIGLWYQLKFILTNKWTGPSGDAANSRFYCTEAVANWVNKVRPNTFSKEEATGLLDIEFNKYYNLIYDGAIIN